MNTLEDYYEIVGDELIYTIHKKARKLYGKHILHINSTYQGGGVAEIYDDKIRILVNYAERPGDIDLERAMQAKQRAEKRIEDSSGEWDLDRAAIALFRAITRIRLASES